MLLQLLQSEIASQNTRHVKNQKALTESKHLQEKNCALFLAIIIINVNYAKNSI